MTGYGIWQRDGGPEAGQRMSGKKPEAEAERKGRKRNAGGEEERVMIEAVNLTKRFEDITAWTI